MVDNSDNGQLKLILILMEKLLLLLKEQAALKGTISLGRQEKRKDGKTWIKIEMDLNT